MNLDFIKITRNRFFILHTTSLLRRSNFLFWTKNLKNVLCIFLFQLETYKNRNRYLVPPDLSYTYECNEIDDISAPQKNNHL